MKQVFFFILLLSTPAVSQIVAYPKNYFRSPVAIQIALSGNFGELRPNHFHTGIDITTKGVEGVPIKASAEGYVSKIKISHWGYGKVIYVTHPNGFTTVYGHLSDFNTAIAEFIKTSQYAKESYEIELLLTPDQFNVKQGEIIAYSGNTGGSGGPHLHFEIRDTKTEEAINPLLFSMPVKDNVAPTLFTLLVCPANTASVVNGTNGIHKFSLIKSGNEYILQNPKDSIIIFGQVGFAIEANDKENIPTGKNGIYGIKLECDNKIIYASRLERMPFDKSRYINSFIDFAEMRKNNHFYMRSFVLPNNQLPIYDSLVENGYCYFETEGIHQFRYTISDVFGNSSTLRFKVYAKAKQPTYKNVQTNLDPFSNVILWDTTTVFEESSFRLEVPAGAVYKNELFKHSVIPAKGKKLSPKVFIDEMIPLQKPCTLSVYANVPKNLQSRAVLAMTNKNGNKICIGGTWEENKITAEIKEFGNFTIVIDSIGPKITTENFDLKGIKQSSLTSLKFIRFKISDNFSGIAFYKASIDGKWVLMQYEPKKKYIWYNFDEHCKPGNHDLVLEVTDKVGNKTTYKKSFLR